MKKTIKDLKVKASEQCRSPGSSESLQQVIHVTGFSGCPAAPPPHHQITSAFTRVSRGSAHQNQERNSGNGEGSTQVFPFFQRDPRRLPRDHRAPRKPAVGASVRLTTGSSFRATPTYPLAAAMYFLDLAHRTDCHLHAHTRCRCAQTHTQTHLYLCGDECWHALRLQWQELTLSRVTCTKGFSHFVPTQMAAADLLRVLLSYGMRCSWLLARGTRLHTYRQLSWHAQGCPEIRYWSEMSYWRWFAHFEPLSRVDSCDTVCLHSDLGNMII